MGTVIENEVQYLTDEAGEKTAVVVPIEEYNELLEDLHDLALIAERKNESAISHEDLVEKILSCV
ncbi:MAG TPA: hypothetical protein VGO50_03385 [Pyrinomonadaceae bacterium]|jgi:hypothetical protein|nr:hypothetical protein [Pyrinomonadaceae bacterium]